jgi:GntR family transcriptional regulator, rspAB operon transcriptional repressor
LSRPHESNGRARPLHETAYQHVRQGILSGEYPIGSVVSDGEVAELLGMSKTPVGQALRRLDGEGLLERGSRLQFVVRDVPSEARREVIELREALEGIALAHACRTMSIDEIDELRLSLIRQRRAADAGSETEFVQLDETFHLIIARGARLVTLERFLGQLAALARLMRSTTPAAQSDLYRLLDEHTAIVDALEMRNEEAAQRALAEHLHGPAETLVAG